MNLSPLALSCSRIPLVQVGVQCLLCGGWALVLLSSKNNISHPIIKSPTPPFKFGYPSTTKGFLSYQIGKLVKESRINVVSRHSNQQCLHVEMQMVINEIYLTFYLYDYRHFSPYHLFIIWRTSQGQFDLFVQGSAFRVNFARIYLRFELVRVEHDYGTCSQMNIVVVVRIMHPLGCMPKTNINGRGKISTEVTGESQCRRTKISKVAQGVSSQ